HALRPFLAFRGVESVVVALSPRDAGDPPHWLVGEDPRIRVVSGGESRSESVLAALKGLDPGIDVVVVHDAARPLADEGILERCLAGVGPELGAIAGWPVGDTLKE